MKRDMDLCRKILLEIENTPHDNDWTPLDFGNFSEEEVSYHVMLLAQSGLIEAYNMSGGNNLVWQPKRLTWQGHEFLDAARDDTIWKKGLSQAGALGFEVLKQVLVQLIKVQLQLPPG